MVSQGESEIGETIAYLSDLVAEDKSQNLEVDIYASGVLGSEPAMVEMVQAGVLDMAKISAGTLGQFDERYSIFLTAIFVPRSGTLLQCNGKQ